MTKGLIKVGETYYLAERRPEREGKFLDPDLAFWHDTEGRVWEVMERIELVPLEPDPFPDSALRKFRNRKKLG